MKRALSVTCVALVACGGGGGGGGSGVDAPSHDGGGDGPVSTCEAPASYTVTTLGSAAQEADEQGSGTTGADSHLVEYEGKLNGDTQYDQLVIELFAGIGPFAGSDVTPQSITLSGPELNYKSCGACVRVFANVDETGSGSVGQFYMATGGTLDLTSTRGDLTATLTNVTLTHVTIADDFTSTPVGDCDTKFPSLAIAAHIDQLVGSD